MESTENNDKEPKSDPRDDTSSLWITIWKQFESVAKHPAVVLLILALVAAAMLYLVIPDTIKYAQSQAIAAGAEAKKASEDADSVSAQSKKLKEQLEILVKSQNDHVKAEEDGLRQFREQLEALRVKLSPFQSEVNQLLDDPAKKDRAIELLREIAARISPTTQPTKLEDILTAARLAADPAVRVTEWRRETLTSSWGSNVKISAYSRYVGKTLELRIRVTPLQSAAKLQQGHSDEPLWIAVPEGIEPEAEALNFAGPAGHLFDDVGTSLYLFSNSRALTGICGLLNDPYYGSPKVTAKHWQLGTYFIVWASSDKGGSVTPTRLETMKPSSFGSDGIPPFVGNDCCFELSASFRTK